MTISELCTITKIMNYLSVIYSLQCVNSYTTAKNYR